MVKSRSPRSKAKRPRKVVMKSKRGKHYTVKVVYDLDRAGGFGDFSKFDRLVDATVRQIAHAERSGSGTDFEGRELFYDKLTRAEAEAVKKALRKFDARVSSFPYSEGVFV